MRDKIAHQYDHMNLQELYDTATKDILVLRTDLREVQRNERLKEQGQISTASAGPIWVKGHDRKGHWVRGHWRKRAGR